MAVRIIRDKTPGVAIVDPFYMRENRLRQPREHATVIEYLKNFMLANKKKDYIPMPYHPEPAEKCCILICFLVQHSIATYFDSRSATKKNYTNINNILNDALIGYVKAGDTIKHPKMKHGQHVFTHTTEFSCIKQPSTSEKDAFYALHHMRSFIWDANDLTLPSHLQGWAQNLAKINDSNIRAELFNIQQDLATMIYEEVMTKGRLFFDSYRLPSNKEIEDHVVLQGDTRTFMTIAKGAPRGFVNMPEPSRK